MNHHSSSTLVLNKNWAAVQVCSVKRAISLIYQGHALVIDPENYQTYDFEDWKDVSQKLIKVDSKEIISSPSLTIRIPKIIVLLFYDKMPKNKIKFSRKNLFERDKWTCQYCGKKPVKSELNLDHIIPKALGGKTTWENIVASCFKCNTKKGVKTLNQLGWKLKKVPKKPDYNPILSIYLGKGAHKEWANFIDISYWYSELENENQKIAD